MVIHSTLVTLQPFKTLDNTPNKKHIIVTALLNASEKGDIYSGTINFTLGEHSFQEDKRYYN